jgi:hypothetical protein
MPGSTIRSPRSRRSAERRPPAPVPARRAPSPELIAAARRRTRAAEAYCTELRLGTTASTAAATHAGSPSSVEHADLLRALRILGAEHAAVDPQSRGWRRVLAAERECSFTPFLLAACLNDEVSDGERARFERHLNSCLTCQAAELRTGRAERAFTGILRGHAALFSRVDLAPGPRVGAQPPQASAVAPVAPAGRARTPPRRLGVASAGSAVVVGLWVWRRRVRAAQ